MQAITPFLWFDDKAEEAMNFYVSIFKNSKVLSFMPGPNGTVMSATFELDGQEFMALNGGRCSLFRQRSHSLSSVRPKRKLTTSGHNFPLAAKPNAVAGSRTNMACRGKSFPIFWANCWVTGPRKGGTSDAGDVADGQN